MRQRLAAGAAACVLAFSNLAFGQATVEGTLTIDGTSVTLKHAYVYYHMNEEKALDSQEIRILLTDSDVPAQYLARPVLTRLDSLAREGKFRGVLLRYDPLASDREVHGTIYSKPKDAAMSMPFFTLSGDSAGFSSLSFMPHEMSAEVENNNDESTFEDMPKYSYKASFTAPVQEGPELTATLEGQEALESPQAQAALQFQRAMREGKIDAAKAVCTEARAKDIDNFIRQIGEDTFRAQASELVPDPDVYAKQLKTVYVREGYALVVFDEEGGTSSVEVVKQGDAWKLD